MKFFLVFSLYDFWVGWHWNRKQRRLYVLVLPCLGFAIEFPAKGLDYWSATPGTSSKFGHYKQNHFYTCADVAEAFAAGAKECRAVGGNPSDHLIERASDGYVKMVHPTTVQEAPPVRSIKEMEANPDEEFRSEAEFKAYLNFLLNLR